MNKGLDRGSSDRARGIRAPNLVASIVLVLAAGTNACGDSSEPAVMQGTPSATPAPSSSTTPTSAETAPASDGQATAAPTTPGSNEGEGTPVLVAPGSMGNAGGAAPPSTPAPATDTNT